LRRRNAVPVIDKANSIPYYDQLAEILRCEISEKQAEGEAFQLPSENELAEQHGLSRATVRHALDKLEREGWIYRQKGVGSFAVVRRVEQELTRLDSTTEAMRLRGWSLVTQLLSVRQMAATHHIERALELVPGEMVYELRRLRIVDDLPLSLQTAYLPIALCPRLEENDLTASLYRLLETRYGLRLWTGQETLRARRATPAEALLLGIGEEIPVLFAERITYAANGTAVEYLEAVWRGDRYDFKVTLSRPN
jgi:GntR family transcriptional regulator